MDVRNRFVADMRAERARQIELWGDDHDNEHTSLEWAGILAREIGAVADDAHNEEKIYRAVVRVAATCMAIAEWLERLRGWREYLAALGQKG